MFGLNVAVFTILFLVWSESKPVDGGYLITTSRVYRTGSVQSLNVDLHGDSDIWNITAFLKITRNNEIISQASQLFHGNSQGIMKIQVPQSVPTRYGVFNNVYLQVHGVNAAGGKPDFRNKQALTLEKQENKLFIQTDKPIYKPGQTIRLRVIGINADLKPLFGEVKRIFISNPKEVRMIQWNDVEFQNGIASVSMLLSKHPVLGNWKIQAQHQGQEVYKIVEVAKYVRPTFEVIIKAPPFISVDSKIISGFICARYTYDLVVYGRLRATFDLKGHQILTIDKKMQGCYEFSFTNQELGLTSLQNSFSRVVLNITANVTEESTGITSSTSSDIEIERYRVNLNFNIGTPRYFKPGLPFYGQLHVTAPDGKTAKNENITITARENGKTVYKNTFWVLNGIVNFEIPNIRQEAKKLILKAEHSASSGAQSRTHNFECLSWFSKSSSFLSLKKLSRPVKVGSLAKIRFVFKDKENITNIFYQLMCGGNLAILSKESRISTKKIAPKVTKGSIEFLVTQTMVPSCRLLVYYVRQDGETVADSMVVDVEDKLENQVFVRFSDDVRRPGEPVQITMTATPGSTVALAAVDKSVLLLKQGKDFNSEQLVSTLSSNNVGPTDRYKRKKKCYKDEGYVDSSKAFYDAGLIYLSDSDIESRPCPTFPPSPTDPPRAPPRIPRDWGFFLGLGPYPCIRFGRRRRRFVADGYFPFPPCWYRFRGGQSWQKKIQQITKQMPKIKSSMSLKPARCVIPETWLWSEQIMSNNSNQMTITAKVPDTITSWHLSGFAMSSTGMGVADPSTLTVFQPFFVSFTLPYSVIRGEEVSVITTVFNYMNKCATVRIRLTKTDHFELNSTTDHSLCICGNEAKSVKYVITPVLLGHIPLMVTVQNTAPSLCANSSDETPAAISDAVTRKLLVEPEGVPQELTYTEFICPRGRGFNDDINLQLPKLVVPDSVRATISVAGDIMGPSISGLQRLLDLPVGCGEQNMVNFAPNIFIMQYLNRTRQNTEEIHKKAVSFLRTGYQRELTYKRKDGSYSAFGNKDEEGSLWLTAFVLRSFSQARQFIFVDENEIKSITNWIKSKQLDTGCFKKHGELFRKELKGGVSTPVTLTAYVLISLLESKIIAKNDKTITKGLECIMIQKDSVTDTYSNAIIAYALTLAQHPGRGKFLTRLNSRIIVKDGKMYWEMKQKSNENIKRDDRSERYRRSSSINIETTSYALMAIIGDGTHSDAIWKTKPIVRWLTQQRNALGGFSSTQDTSVALQALSRYAEYFYGTELMWMTITVGQNSEKTFHHKFHVNYGNRMILQRIELPPKLLSKKIPINAVGMGCALVQAHVTYNIPNSEEKPAFNLSVFIRPPSIKKQVVLKSKAGERLCQSLDMHICAEWLEKGISDMAVIDVKLASGFSPDEESLERLSNRIDLGLKDFEVEKNKVVFYFNEIKNVCFSFGVHQTSVVKNTKSASVSVYEYYEIDNSAVVEYNITENLCESKSADLSPGNCPLCPQKLNLNDIQSLLCQMKNVVLSKKLMNGRRRPGLIAIPQDRGSQVLGSTRRFPVEVILPQGCRCSSFMSPHSNVFVLFKKQRSGKKPKRLQLNQSMIVLDDKMISKSALRNALIKCGASIEVYASLL